MIRQAASQLLLAGAVLLAPQGLRAQHGADSVSFNRAIRSYTLTMAHLTELKQAGINIQNYAKSHRDEAQKWTDASDNGDGTIDDQVRRIDAISPFRQAIASTGLSTRDYLLTTITFFQASMADGLQDSYAKTKQKAPVLPGNVNPANVTFIHVHKAEIEKLKLGELVNSSGG
ncbi:MAG: hypothetical protein ABI026_10835 [Gemmatimonadaceae bacterium]